MGGDGSLLRNDAIKIDINCERSRGDKGGPNVQELVMQSLKDTENYASRKWRSNDWRWEPVEKG